MLEMAHSALTSEETDQLVEKMFVTAELDKHGVLTLENFVKMLAGEQRMMWDVSLEWKGTGRLCSPTHIYTYDRESHTVFVPIATRPSLQGVGLGGLLAKACACICLA